MTTTNAPRRGWISAVAVALLLLPAAACAYTGVLASTDSGLLGTGAWIDPGPASLTWWVTDNGNGSWHYKYFFTHPSGATSHFILETSLTFTENDIFNATGDFGAVVLGTYTGGPGSNPNMPGSVYGIKFDEATGIETTIEFDAWRSPMWGDFYAKNGKVPGTDVWNTAWNAGFAAADPTSPFHDGPESGHLLVPDTQGPPPPVPEPSTLILLGSGLAGTLAFIRRRRG